MMKALGLIAVILLLAHTARAQFVPPHGLLPSDNECASRVVPTAENRPSNQLYNDYVPSPSEMANFYHNPLNFTAGPASSFFRVDGSYGGHTTDEIAQWAACKWGQDPDMMRAQMWIESGWNQSVRGDDEFERDLCLTGNGIDLWQPGNYCYTSYSIVQIKVTNYNAAPMAWESTPWALDFRGAYWRSCLNGEIGYYKDSATLPGYPKYPNGTPEEMALGCTGSWFSGGWYDQLSMDYISHYKKAYADKPWLPPVRFKEPVEGSTVQGQVRLAITTAANTPCFWACVSNDSGGFISCEPGGGPWTWDTTVRTPNGHHVVTLDTYFCANNLPTGWQQPSVSVTVQNGAVAATQQSAKPSWAHEQGAGRRKPPKQKNKPAGR